jgi:HSP20 family protein
MAGLVKRESKSNTPIEAFDRFDRVFDRMFDDWARLLPFRRPAMLGGLAAEDVIRVDEFREDGTLVVRADLPGIDPDKDVEITVSDGMLNIEAERHAEEKKEEKGYVRQELRYGSFSRSLRLPEGATDSDVTASYKDGILEIRVPAPEPKVELAKKIAVSKS